MAVRTDQEGGQDGAVQAMPHGVEDGEVEDARVEGVVETVAADLVGGFEQPSDGHPRGTERQRR